MARIRYNGPVPSIELRGFGHFAPGDIKQVDALTAAQLSVPACKAEGWEVLPDVEAPSVPEVIGDEPTEVPAATTTMRRK